MVCSYYIHKVIYIAPLPPPFMVSPFPFLPSSSCHCSITVLPSSFPFLSSPHILLLLFSPPPLLPSSRPFVTLLLPFPFLLHSFLLFSYRSASLPHRLPSGFSIIACHPSSPYNYLRLVPLSYTSLFPSCVFSTPASSLMHNETRILCSQVRFRLG